MPDGTSKIDYMKKLGADEVGGRTEGFKGLRRVEEGLQVFSGNGVGKTLFGRLDPQNARASWLLIESKSRHSPMSRHFSPAVKSSGTPLRGVAAPMLLIGIAHQRSLLFFVRTRRSPKHSSSYMYQVVPLIGDIYKTLVNWIYIYK